MKNLPTYLDRYPAKMVAHLAARLVTDYASGAESVLDPFCGSGAVLSEAARRGIWAHGLDLNPYAVLLSMVKLQGFDALAAWRVWAGLRSAAIRCKDPFLVSWKAKNFWFRPTAIRRYEQLREVFRRVGIGSTRSGRAILLAYALSVRRCSRADQRSPKPFISKMARFQRRGIHFDPIVETEALLLDLSKLYGCETGIDAHIEWGDVTRPFVTMGPHSHVITSPPYINAQDYFRNFKLELHLLEGVLPFSVEEIRAKFIGTERGDLLAGIHEHDITRHRAWLPQLCTLAERCPRSAAVVHRYLRDMGSAFDNIKACLRSNGTLVLVCGDNLIGGERLSTWRVLAEMLEERGFQRFDYFSDPIGDRLLAPKRCGHKGLIKEEVVQAFRLN